MCQWLRTCTNPGMRWVFSAVGQHLVCDDCHANITAIYARANARLAERNRS